MAKKIFISYRKPECQIVVRSDDHEELGNGRMRVIKGKRATFLKNAQGVGEFRTDDAEIIDFLKAHEWINAGIIEGPFDEVPAKALAKKGLAKVKAGAADTVTAEPLPDAPPEQQKAPVAAKIPGRKAKS